MDALIISDSQINCRRQQCEPALPVNLCLLPRTLSDDPEHEPKYKEKEQHMQEDHGRVKHGQEPCEQGKAGKKQAERNQPARPFLSSGRFSDQAESADRARQIDRADDPGEDHDHKTY